MDKQAAKTLTEYPSWDRTTRWFHWINFVSVLCLIIIGTIILNGKTLGVSGDGKVLLKTIHVLVGYLFFLNLLWRLIWAFIGSPTARWRSLLPGGEKYRIRLRAFITGIRSGKAPAYIGHNPLGRLMVTFLLFALLVQGATGLILAGTDIYYPPFGGQIAQWVTGGDPEKLARLEPGSKEFVDPDAYADMRDFRSPVITTHLYLFYGLLIAILIHIIAVVFAENRESGSIISSMFSGRKVLSQPPEDLDEY